MFVLIGLIVERDGCHAFNLPAAIVARYEVHEWKHACAIQRLPAEWMTFFPSSLSFASIRLLTVGGGAKSKWPGD
jgi:hypothetical protein